MVKCVVAIVALMDSLTAKICAAEVKDPNLYAESGRGRELRQPILVNLLIKSLKHWQHLTKAVEMVRSEGFLASSSQFYKCCQKSFVN